MSRRIEIELTSARPDGTWTWRAAGAREPRGVVAASVIPDSSKVGDVLKVEADFELEGINILSVVVSSRTRKEPTLIELLPSERSFEPVTQTLAKRERRERGAGGDRPRRDRDRDRPRRDGDDRRGPRPDGERRGSRPDGAARGDRPDRPDRPRRERPPRPRYEAPPELPQRPRPKRLKPGKVHRTAVLNELDEAQRPIAEKALQGGIPAVRQAVNEQNRALRAAGQEEIPAAGLLKMAEELLPRLRVAEWLDRADAAKADLDELDLRDLRSVVASADDPMVARDDNTRELAAELKAALATKQEKASQEWLEDIGLALGVGRVIRALKLSSEPPKAGMRFPTDLAHQLAEAATAALTPEDTADRWSAVLEAVAFSPVRAHVTPAAGPSAGSDALTATVTRLAPLIPQIAALFGITPAPGAPMPKPQRMTRKPERKPGEKPSGAPKPEQATKRPAPAEPAPQAAPAKEPAPGTSAPTRDAPSAGDTASASDTAPAEAAPAEAAPANVPGVDDDTAPIDAPAADDTAPTDAPAADDTAPTDAPAADDTAPIDAPTDAPAADDTAPIDAPTAAPTDAPAGAATDTTTDPGSGAADQAADGSEGSSPAG